MQLRRSFSRPAALAVAAAIIIVLVAQRQGAVPVASLRENPDIGPFQGLGVWVDIYDHSAWGDPGAAVRDMAAHGVKTLYLQTSNVSRPSAFVYEKRVGLFVDAAHAAGVRIVAWYLPGFQDLGRDAARSKAAISFKTATGNRFDGFALDIESPAVKRVGLRTARLLDLSAQLRAFAGDDYPLGAIIPSPYGMVVHAKYWPGFPYQQLAALYDALLPMSYFTWHHPTADGTSWYIAKNVTLIRQEVGSDEVPIHVIGGIAQDASEQQAQAFVDTVRERGLIGASYYTFPGIDAGEWPVLGEIPANPVEAPGGPIPVKTGGTAELGNIPGLDTTHPNEVVYTASRRSHDEVLGFDVYDAQAGEISIYVNWQPLATVEAGVDGDWSGPRSVDVPASALHADGPNLISFVPNDPGGGWGVRAVTLVRLVPQ